MDKYEVKHNIEEVIRGLDLCKNPNETTSDEMVLEYWEIVNGFPVKPVGPVDTKYRIERQLCDSFHQLAWELVESLVNISEPDMRTRLTAYSELDKDTDWDGKRYNYRLVRVQETVAVLAER
jgi:hypothetical protein